MAKLPVITAMGGVNAAGRTSGHHSYRRMIFDSLSQSQAQLTAQSLAALTNRLKQDNNQWLGLGEPVNLEEFIAQQRSPLLEATLIRKLEHNLFDPAQLPINQRTRVQSAFDNPLQIKLRTKDLPSPLPSGWDVQPGNDEKHVNVTLTDHLEVLLPTTRAADVNSAGQLPSGFDPAALYASRNHPRGLQLTVFAASDAINSLGIDWDAIRQYIAPDQISVYAGSGMGQLDYNGYGGMLQARLLGKKVTSKQLPLGYAEMPADFVNAYLLGNLGTTGTNIAACATFLYNLRQGIRDIQSGTHRLVIVGNSEAPLMPEVFEGFSTMGALADDNSLRKIDGLSADELPDFRRACRPFGYNAGFTLAESAQFLVLMDDELALELGANILGAVNDVFINADGFKKSIASPGLGNYLSVAKAASATRNIIGDKGLRQRSYVQAHGTGTLQNRQTESHILNHIAQTFGIESWPVTAVKAYVGHSLATSAGDQVVSTLGFWADGILPGITTIDGIADDVYDSHLDFLLQHRQMSSTDIDATIINSKGFGGNNASASILSPHLTRAMLEKRHGKDAMKKYRTANESVSEQSAEYDAAMCAGHNRTIYHFDNNVLGSEAIEMTDKRIAIKNIKPEVSLNVKNLYEDMCD